MGKIAIYPGTFDPITFGHIDVIKKGLKLFDKIVVAVSDVENKNYLFIHPLWGRVLLKYFPQQYPTEVSFGQRMDPPRDGQR